MSAPDLRDTPTPVTACPYCGHRLDRAMAGDPKEPDATPSEGDLSVCISCSSIMVFAADLTLRRPEPGEIKAKFAEQPDLAEGVGRAQAAVRSLDRRTMRNS